MPQLQFALYRTLYAALDGVEIPPPETRRARALLTFLLLNPAPTTSRRAIAALFWPELDEERAASAIRQNLYLIRRWFQTHLGSTEMIVTNGASVSLQRTALHVDVLLLEDALTAQQTHQHRNPTSCSACLQLLEAALAQFRPFDLHREAFLEDSFEQWLDQRLGAVPGRFGQAAVQLIAAALRVGQLNDAERLARAWIAVDPFAEAAHRALAACLARNDRRAAALQHLRLFIRQFEQEFGTAPEPETLRLLTQLTLSAGELQRLDTYRAPAPPAPVIGRDSELARLEQLIAQPHVRLIALSGIGGIGKTSLALLAAHRFAAEFEHGALFVPLFGITDVDQAALAVAEAARVTLTGRDPLPKQLADALSERNLLLILDNLEQLPDSERLIDPLLQSAPQLLLLTTSRRPLDHLRQHVLALSGLALTPPTDDDDVAPPDVPTLFSDRSPLNHAPLPAAEQLFLQVAAQHLAATAVLDRTDVAAVCRTLAGHPLAISLAAHQLQHTDLARLRATLQHNQLAELAAAAGTEQRHRTIRFIIQESLAGVDSATATLLSAAALFSDAVSPAALVAVAQLPEPDAAAALQQARRSGLLEHSADSYHLHPLIRVAGPPADTEIQQRFAHYHLTLITTPELDFVSSAARDWAHSRRPVLRDLLHAVELALQHGLFIPVINAAFRLATLALMSGQQLIVIMHFQRVLPQLPAQPAATARDCRQRLAASALWLRLTTLDAATVLREAETLLADPAVSSGSLDWLLIRRCRTSALLYARHLDQAEADLADLEAVTAPAPPADVTSTPIELYQPLGLHGRLALYRGDYAGAAPLLRQAADQRGAVGDQRGQLSFLSELAESHFRNGDARTALAILDEAVTRARRADDRTSIATLLSNCGALRIELKEDFVRAEQELLEALELSRTLGLRLYRRSPLHGIIMLRYRHRDYSAMLAPCLEFLRLELQLGVRPIGLQVAILLAEALTSTRPLLAAELLDLVAHHRLADAALQTACSRQRAAIPVEFSRTAAPADVDAELHRLLAMLP
jgi:DNA-binding SARP family transcriptional activator